MSEQKTKRTGRWEKCITDCRGDPNWCVGWIIHLVSVLPALKVSTMTVIKVESGRDGINGGRLNWSGECKTEHQRRIEDISVSCQILSRLVLHLHFRFLSQSSIGETNRLDIFMRKQLPHGAAWLSDGPHLISSLKPYRWNRHSNKSPSGAQI